MDDYPLFVYGTLRRDQPNQVLLQGRTERILPGWMEGVVLYDLGAYSMMVEGQGRVLGEVVFLKPGPRTYAITLDLLDRIEGVDGKKGLYRRVLRPACLAGGHETLAWVYLGQYELVRGRPRVKSGDWVTHLAGG
jgi:gamma-glutamylcyclotransferase (GGCT)/AIG2-like uncharacterized protein YtfP